MMGPANGLSLAMIASCFGMAGAASELTIHAVRLGETPAVGAPFVVEYTMDGPTGSSIIPPALPPSEGPFDVIDVHLAGPRTLAITYVTWSSEEASIPSIAVTVVEADGSSHASSLPAVPVCATSSLSEEDPLVETGPHLGYLSIPGEFPLREVAAAFSAMAILGCAAGAWMLRRRPMQRPSPEEIALSALDGLEAHEEVPGKDPECFWFEVTDILRQYIGARFGLLAPTLTTREFLAQARERLPVAQEQRDRLRLLLDHADGIKFARHRATKEDGRKALVFVRRFVTSHAPSSSPDEGQSARSGAGDTAPREESTC